MRALWSAAVYWPLWLGATVGTFALREFWALATRHPQDTLSDWIWRHLHIVAHESVGQWSAVDLLVFCAYVTVFVIWLPYHFFWHRFT